MSDRDEFTPHTEADRTSQTRFGPRPVPKGHIPHGQRHESRRVIPHGDVSPDGKRAWPRPSLTARLIVWGGTGIAVAAATAGTVLAMRHVADLVAGEPGPKPHRRKDPQPIPPRPQPVPRRKPPQPHLMDEIEENTRRLTGTVDGVVGSLGSAVAGFRSVASQAASIAREFGDTAELVRGLLNHRTETRQPEPRHRDDAPDTPGADTDRFHRL